MIIKKNSLLPLTFFSSCFHTPNTETRMAINVNTRPRKSRRKLPLKSIVDPELVSAPSTMTDDILLLPSQHDRVILSQLWDNHQDEQRSTLAPVILGILNQKKQAHVSLGVPPVAKTYLQRLQENNVPTMFDLSSQSIIPISIANNMNAKQQEHDQYTFTPSSPPLSFADDEEISVSPVSEKDEEVRQDDAAETIDSEAVQDTNSVELDGYSEDSSGHDERGWLDFSRKDDQQEKVYQDIFDMMSITPSPSASGLELVVGKESAGSKLKDLSRKNKLAVLKASKALDWIENSTNPFLSRKQQKLQRRRRQKLRDKLEQPYIVKKKIKCIWYIE